MPTWLHVSAILSHLKSTNVRQALEVFHQLKFSGLYEQADLTDTLDRLELFAKYKL
jgi:hypothetical protein